MRLQDVIPYMVCVNLAPREDRRREAWGRFAAAGLSVDRQPGVLKRTVTDPRGFKNAARYSCSLAKRLAIRRAKLAGAPAVLLFEDDVVLAPDLNKRLAEIELPEDWGIFFLGCKHLERPEIIAPGLVKVKRAADHHAMAIRADFFDAAIRGLAGYGKGSPHLVDYSDVKMSEIQAWVPTYAALPNLAWQALSHSDNAGSRQTHYDEQGRQKTVLYAVKGLDAEMKCWRANRQVSVSEMTKEGMLPARGDVSLVESSASREAGETPAPCEQLSAPLDVSSAVSPSGCEAGEPPAHLEGALPPFGASEGDSAAEPPRVWTAADNEPPAYHYVPRELPRQQLEESFPLRLYINLGRREDRRAEAEYQFALQDLEVERLPAADGRWVTNTRGHGPPNRYACGLSHRLALRTARQRGAPAVLIFEDDVILHPQFRRIAETLIPPTDWGVLFFGCTHVESPETVAPGWVRATHVWGTHAYVVRAEWYGTLLKALRAPGIPGEDKAGTDVEISRLSDRIPMYAAYPNLAWQDEGYSDLMGVYRHHFRKDGRQNRLLHVLRETNREMKALIHDEYGREGLLKRDHALLRPGDAHAGGHERQRRWKFEDEFSKSSFLNLESRVDRRERAEERFREASIEVRRFPAFRGVGREARGGLPAGAYGCALSHRALLRAAISAGERAVLIFEDDAVLHPRAVEWAESMVLPGDWGIIYLGCLHVETPEPLAPGLVRVKGAYSTHAYAVKASYFHRVAAAMGRGSRAGIACDVILSRLAKEIPSYAFYPNLVWQEPGHSDVKGARRTAFGPDGVQRLHRECLAPADQSMRQLLNWRQFFLTGPGRTWHGRPWSGLPETRWKNYGFRPGRGMPAAPGDSSDRRDREGALVVVKALRFANSVQQVANSIKLGIERGLRRVYLPNLWWLKSGSFALPEGLEIVHLPDPEIPDDDWLIHGTFFDLRPLDSSFGKPHEHRRMIHSLLPWLKIQPDGPPLDDRELVIHLRSGDVMRGSGSHPGYGQPPLAFYRHVLDLQPWDRIHLVAEDDSHPLIPHLRHECGMRAKYAERLGKPLSGDLAFLLRAKKLVASRGTFISAISALSTSLREIHYFDSGFCSWGKENLSISVWSDLKGDYKRKVLSKNWRNNREQRQLMLDYPSEAVGLKDVFSGCPEHHCGGLEPIF